MGLFDGIIGSVVSGIGGIVQNSANAAEAQKNRDFQEQMSNTAYQRGMADMKAAGLNPILAYQKGPASSPTGNMAVATNVGEAMTNSFNNSARTASDNAKTDAGTSLTQQELENAKLTADQIRANTAKTMADTTNVNVQTRLTEAAIPKTQQEVQKLQSENSARSADSAFYSSKFGTGARWLGNTLNEINPLKGLIGGSAR